MKWSEFLTKHRNTFLLLLLVGTLYVSSMAERSRLEEDAQTVSIPVIAQEATAPLSALDAYRQTRDSAYLSDKASLEALCNQGSLDRQTRQDAAERLQALVDQHQAALALEGALLNSELSPCVAVVTSGGVTIVTEKEAPSDNDTALVLSLAATHAEADPANVQIITAD